MHIIYLIIQTISAFNKHYIYINNDQKHTRFYLLLNLPYNNATLMEGTEMFLSVGKVHKNMVIHPSEAYIGSFEPSPIISEIVSYMKSYNNIDISQNFILSCATLIDFNKTSPLYCCIVIRQNEEILLYRLLLSSEICMDKPIVICISSNILNFLACLSKLKSIKYTNAILKSLQNTISDCEFTSIQIFNKNLINFLSRVAKKKFESKFSNMKLDHDEKMAKEIEPYLLEAYTLINKNKQFENRHYNEYQEKIQSRRQINMKKSPSKEESDVKDEKLYKIIRQEMTHLHSVKAEIHEEQLPLKYLKINSQQDNANIHKASKERYISREPMKVSKDTGATKKPSDAILFIESAKEFDLIYKAEQGQVLDKDDPKDKLFYETRSDVGYSQFQDTNPQYNAQQSIQTTSFSYSSEKLLDARFAQDDVKKQSSLQKFCKFDFECGKMALFVGVLLLLGMAVIVYKKLGF